MRTRINLNGQRFHRLTVIGLIGTRKGHCEWLCRCDCGRFTRVLASNLKTGSVKSCGCGRPAFHGKSNSRVYRAWRAMMNRCYRPRTESYPHYGGRGITVCERWHTFVNFYADMGDPPPKLSLERKDSNGHYEPDNCKWATVAEQNRNKTTNRRATINGKTQILAEWIRELGLSKATTQSRINSGWSVEDALLVPQRKYRPRRVKEER